MTQEDFAEKADLDRKTISNVERDVGIPNYGSILSIALALNLTPIEFGEEVENILKY